MSMGSDNSKLISLGPTETEIRFAYTLGPYRRLGLQTHTIAHIVSDLKASLIDTVYSHVLLHNTASLKAFVISGFKPDALVTVWRIMGLPIRTICSPVPPAVLNTLHVFASPSERP
jgi:hypothetical protein